MRYPTPPAPTTYAPAGQVMSSGAIPVFVGRDLVPPFREQFDWESFSFMFSPDEVGPSMVKTLQSVPPEKLREMQVSRLLDSRDQKRNSR